MFGYVAEHNSQEFMGAKKFILVLLKETVLTLTNWLADCSSAGKIRLHDINCQVYTGSLFFKTFINSVLHHRAACF